MPIPKSIPAPRPQTTGLTNFELRLTPVPVSITGAITATITGMSTEAKQDVGNASLASIDAKLTSPITVTGTVTTTGLTDAQLRASPVPISGTITGITNPVAVTGTFWQATQPVSGPLTDAQLRATAVPISGAVSVSNFPATQPVSGTVAVSNFPASQAVTNAGTFAVQATLAAETTKVIGTVNQGTSPWVVSGTVTTGGLTDAQLRATAVPVSGPLTDAQLRATPVPVSGTLALSGTVSTKTALTASAPAAATVGVASAQVVAASATRKGLILVNTSANTISLGFGSAAVLNSGVTLISGFAYNMAEYDFHVGAVNAIASAASSNLSIQEYTT